MIVNGEPRCEEFDKVVFCHGYQTKPVMPKYDGQDVYEGRLMHAQQFRTWVVEIFIANKTLTCAEQRA
jgi:dimethylaniline monooxygenase (N-oxide forming)